jgi:hypothetical protein
VKTNHSSPTPADPPIRVELPIHIREDSYSCQCGRGGGDRRSRNEMKWSVVVLWIVVVLGIVHGFVVLCVVVFWIVVDGQPVVWGEVVRGVVIVGVRRDGRGAVFDRVCRKT